MSIFHKTVKFGTFPPLDCVAFLLNISERVWGYDICHNIGVWSFDKIFGVR